MAVVDFTIKQDDTAPALNATLEDSAGDPVNLTGATVRFHMTQHGTSTLKVDAAATIVSAAAGTVRYSWIAANTNTHGRFWGEFQVTFSDGTIQSFPNSRHLEIQVTRDLG